MVLLHSLHKMFQSWNQSMCCCLGLVWRLVYGIHPFLNSLHCWGIQLLDCLGLLGLRYLFSCQSRGLLSSPKGRSHYLLHGSHHLQTQNIDSFSCIASLTSCFWSILKYPMWLVKAHPEYFHFINSKSTQR